MPLLICLTIISTLLSIFIMATCGDNVDGLGADDSNAGATTSAVTPFTSAMTSGLEPLSPPGSGSNYHDWEFAIRAIVMGAGYLPVLLGKKEDLVPQAVWTC
ncbi:hypothetical protein CROQUDRAFT_88143 [Cronartium quercuum f. sp. fusiforme G11]|uniref:Retrotransposon Copia-like N-terminal domain-containing protein n=1 Tax=Cronartium quercuum f. sp. fusiforme G11 TaxID=708437 RepID=A0A9P6NU06_9BASI|nr:hypothetical protein CROQUDRAFT_88143 [Cronartium quercuum f. sp. fusiforme G11]